MRKANTSKMKMKNAILTYYFCLNPASHLQQKMKQITRFEIRKIDRYRNIKVETVGKAEKS